MRNVFTWVENAAERWPDKTAYISEDEALTFKEVYKLSSQVATALLKLGLHKDPVAIMLPKGPSCIAAFFGVAGSGNFYTPLDSKMPVERLKKICRTLEPKAIITSRDMLDVSVFSGGGNCPLHGGYQAAAN